MAAGAAAVAIGLAPAMAAEEAGRAAALCAAEGRVRPELLARMVGAAAGAAALEAGMSMEEARALRGLGDGFGQAAEAAKKAAETEGYAAGLTVEASARAGRLAYDKVLGVIHHSDSEQEEQVEEKDWRGPRPGCWNGVAAPDRRLKHLQPKRRRWQMTIQASKRWLKQMRPSTSGCCRPAKGLTLAN